MFTDTMSEEKATAVLMANLKGRKSKTSHLSEIARACRVLVDKWGFQKMHEFFHVSVFQLRQIDKFNDLEKELQKVVLSNNLGIEISYQLWRLPKEKQVQAGRASADLKAHEVREFVRILLENPNVSIEESKKTHRKKTEGKNQHLDVTSHD